MTPSLFFQEDDSHFSNFFNSTSWHSERCKDLGCDFSCFKKPSQVLPAGELNLLKNQAKLELHKLISPAQCLSHVLKSHTLDNIAPRSEILHPFPSIKFSPYFHGYDNLHPALKHGPLQTYLLDDLSCVRRESHPSGLSLEHNLSTCGHDSAKTPEKPSVEEFLVDALKGYVILGEARNLACLAKTWKGLSSKMCPQDMVENEGVLLVEVSLQNLEAGG